MRQSREASSRLDQGPETSAKNLASVASLCVGVQAARDQQPSLSTSDLTELKLTHIANWCRKYHHHSHNRDTP